MKATILNQEEAFDLTSKNSKLSSSSIIYLNNTENTDVKKFASCSRDKNSCDSDYLLNSTICTTSTSLVKVSAQSSFNSKLNSSSTKEISFENKSININDVEENSEGYFLTEECQRKVSLNSLLSKHNFNFEKRYFVEQVEEDLIDFNLLSKFYFPCIYGEEHYENYIESTLKAISHLNSYFKSSNYKKQLKKIKEAENKPVYVESPITLPAKHKKTIVLDLDETLVRCELLNNYNNKDGYDHIIEEEGLGIYARNGIREFLQETSSKFNLVLFSAGQLDYIMQVLEKLDIKNYFIMILAQHNTVKINNNIYIKDLEMVKDLLIEYFSSNFYHNVAFKFKINNTNTVRQKNDSFNESSYDEEIIIIDNNLYSFSNNLSQGILISSFTGDKNDDELLELLEFIKSIEEKTPGCIDFKQSLKDHFCFEAILNAIENYDDCYFK